MTHSTDTGVSTGRSARYPRALGGAAEGVVAARGNPRRLKAVFDRGLVPMVLLDSRRRCVDINRAAQLWFRRTVDEMRGHAIEDFAPADQLPAIEDGWRRLRESGCITRTYRAAKPDGSRVDLVYFALADVLPALHITVFAPGDWPDESGQIEEDGVAEAASLTAREIELLTLTADGLTGPGLAEELFLSPATVSTHFRNIFGKLRVKSRAAAVAKAMRLGLIY